MYEKTIDDLTKSYNQKHEILTKEENDLKEKLQIEVTKVKERFEKSLFNINNEITINEKINRGVKKLENGEKHKIKILAYVSKINKNKKGIDRLFQKFIKSLKFSYQENDNNIKYEEYYYNGSPIPYDIEYKDNTFIGYNNIELSWKIDDKINNDKINVNLKLS